MRIANDKKALEPVVLDLQGLTDIASYFVICSGTSSRQVKAIVDGIQKILTEKGNNALHYEFDTGYNWIILDYVDVIVHVFNDETRGYYRLDQLWGDAKKVG